MDYTEKDTFYGLLKEAEDVYDTKLKKNVKDTYWKTLRPYELDVVKSAIYSHLRSTERGSRFPLVNDISYYIPRRYPHTEHLTTSWEDHKKWLIENYGDIGNKAVMQAESSYGI